MQNNYTKVKGTVGNRRCLQYCRNLCIKMLSPLGPLQCSALSNIKNCDIHFTRNDIKIRCVYISVCDQDGHDYFLKKKIDIFSHGILYINQIIKNKQKKSKYRYNSYYAEYTFVF